ncbi:MAG: membrane protein [Saprospiraceae bacterium]|nr:MAG: membrane protein [Saprospiraceae bacterium]
MIVWIGFILLVCIFLAIDLGIFNKQSHEIGTAEAFRWTSLWVSISMLFSVFVYFAYENNWMGIGQTVGHPSSGMHAALTYLTGYIVELSLSMDNIFVIAVIFSYFGIPKKYQHRVLFWGILGAVIFRGLFIGAGAWLISHFDFMLYIFGVILLWTAWKMMRAGQSHEVHPEDNIVVKAFRKILPVTRNIYEEQFFVKRNGKIVAMTPLFLALLVVETSDIMFAFDSIPAIFAITTDPFIVFTSNIFAILGLRSMYFVLASVLDKFEHLKYSLAVILAFVGLKMVVFHPLHIDIPEWVSLLVILLLLAVGVISSVIKSKRLEDNKKEHPAKVEKEIYP